MSSSFYPRRLLTTDDSVDFSLLPPPSPAEALCGLFAAELTRAARELGLEQGQSLRLLVGFSCGEDSSVLLHLLSTFAASQDLVVTAAYFNHKLRPESDVEERIAGRLAEKYRFDFRVGRAVGSNGSASEQSEAWARNQRYQFLKTVCEETGSHLIATAHHLRDQAETMLMRMISGRVMTTACGIAALDLERKLWRPLLGVQKSMIEHYSSIHGIEFAWDRTNANLGRTRNWIRHQLIPMLENRYFPELAEHCGQAARRLADDEKFLREAAEERLRDFDAAAYVGAVRRQSRAMRWRYLEHLAVHQLGSDGRRLGYRNLQEAAELILHWAGGEAQLHLGGGISLHILTGGEIEFRRGSTDRDEKSDVPQMEPPVDLPIPGAVVRYYPDGSSAKISTRVISQNEISPELFASSDSGAREARAYFAAAQIRAARITVRERRDGDAMRVWRRGSRKLKKLFQERGIGRPLRDHLPVLEKDDEIIWVPGVARSQWAPVEADSAEVVEIAYTRN